MIEIKWYGRGGQGLDTASHVLALAAFREGYFVQAFPFYGPQRGGAPFTAFNRIDTRKVRTAEQITRPHLEIVMEANLLESEEFTIGKHIKPEGMLLINSPGSSEKIAYLTGFQGKIFTLAAHEIAKKADIKHINGPMLGATAKIVGIRMKTVAQQFEQTLPARLTRQEIENNLKALKNGYKALKIDKPLTPKRPRR